MLTADTKLTFVHPDLVDPMGDTSLLVFGDLGTWILVDKELSDFLNRFDGKQTIIAILQAHAHQWKKPLETVNQEAAGIIPEMLRRGVLYKDAPNGMGEEPLSIANITLNLTNRCNLKCPFCYNGNRGMIEAPISDFVRFMEEGKTVLTEDASLIILGGEPFLLPDRLFSLLKSGNQLFKRAPMVSTNGTHLTPDIIERLKGTRVEVQVSLDSADPKIHDAGRGKGVFEKATDGIRRLVQADVHTIISMVFNENTIEGIEPFLALADSLQVNEARFIPLRLLGRAAETGEKRTPLFFAKALDVVIDILERKPSYARLLARDYFSIAATQCARMAGRVSCGIGRRVIFIDADGAIYPCPNHVSEVYQLGHINETSLETLLLHSKTTQSIRDRYHIDNYTHCRKCPFRRWCAGDCRGETLAQTGSETARSPHCADLKKMYLTLLRRLSQGDAVVQKMAGTLSSNEAVTTFLT